MKYVNTKKLKRIAYLLLISVSLLNLSMKEVNDLYSGTGTISFISDAPLETIRASSKEIKGIIKLSDKTFAFSMPVASFEGFNSPLQKEHFNEHYLETAKFPKSTFTGRIINFEQCGVDCELEVIAKGKLNIHGITKVVSIPITLSMEKEGFSVNGKFNVLLSDYNIEIPLILEGKISPKIEVSIDLSFEKKA